MMTKILAILMALIMVFGLTACSTEEPQRSDEDKKNNVTSNAESKTKRLTKVTFTDGDYSEAVTEEECGR